MWLIVLQLPVKAGWRDVLLGFRDFWWINKHSYEKPKKNGTQQPGDVEALEFWLASH